MNEEADTRVPVTTTIPREDMTQLRAIARRRGERWGDIVRRLVASYVRRHGEGDR